MIITWDSGWSAEVLSAGAAEASGSSCPANCRDDPARRFEALSGIQSHSHGLIRPRACRSAGGLLAERPIYVTLQRCVHRAVLSPVSEAAHGAHQFRMENGWRS